MSDCEDVPIWMKYTLSIQEAANYYGIGEKRLRQLIADKPMADYVLEIGSHVRIKRKLFEQYIDSSNII